MREIRQLELMLNGGPSGEPMDVGGTGTGTGTDTATGADIGTEPNSRGNTNPSLLGSTPPALPVPLRTSTPKSALFSPPTPPSPPPPPPPSPASPVEEMEWKETDDDDAILSAEAAMLKVCILRLWLRLFFFCFFVF